MTDIIRLTISLSVDVQALPYGSPEHGYHYVSVLKKPSAVYDFPELKNEPTMTDFILGVNAPGGLFETARIDHGYFDGLNGEIIRRAAVGFFYRDRELFQEYASSMMFAGNVLYAAQNSLVASDDDPCLVEMQPLLLRQERCRGWIMDVYFAGRGPDKDAARNRLDQLLRKSLPFFQTVGASAPSNPDVS